MKELTGKVAVVTGAASGIGFGMAERFAAAGMKVVLSDIEAEALARADATLRARGADTSTHVADVAKATDVRALAEHTVRTYGAVDVLCNNAGVGVRPGHSWEATPEDWQWILGVNLMGVIHGMQSFLPIMIAQGTEAHVVNTASIAGLTCGEGTLYSVTKHAVVALSEGTQLELVSGGFKPRISVLCPAFVNTNIIESARNRPGDLANAAPASEGPVADAFREWFVDQLKRGLDPQQVGDMVVDAIRAERFYVLTHPDFNPAIEHRFKGILSGEGPSGFLLPSMAPLLEKLARMGALSR
ncbi:MAG: SDR family NAD(P)-dependent oxidoreductase [Polyangiales bacterium]